MSPDAATAALLQKTIRCPCTRYTSTSMAPSSGSSASRPRRASQAAVRRGLSEARSTLRDVADPDTVESAVEVWQAEAARLMAERRAVGLVEEALRGRRFVARL